MSSIFRPSEDTYLLISHFLSESIDELFTSHDRLSEKIYESEKCKTYYELIGPSMQKSSFGNAIKLERRS